MECKNCGNFFYVKRKLLELFNSKKEFICNDCYKKYPIDLQINRLLLDEYHCVIISIFKKRYQINFNCYINEYSKILSYNYIKEGYVSLFLDWIDLYDDYTLEVLDIISKLNRSNLIIVCFYVKK